MEVEKMLKAIRLLVISVSYVFYEDETFRRFDKKKKKKEREEKKTEKVVEKAKILVGIM